MRSQRRSGVMVLTMLALAVAGPRSACAGFLLTNGGFDTPTPGLSPPNYPTSISGASASGPASAKNWALFNNFNATTSTELLPSNDPQGGGFMIHVTSTTNTADPTGSFFNGLLQGFPTTSGGTASVDVDVLSGPVFLGLFANNGATLIDFTLSTVTNQWETLTVTAPPGTNPNLVVVYSYSTTGVGEFYADNAVVTAAAAAPEPASLTLLGLGALGLLGYRWRRRKQAA